MIELDAPLPIMDREGRTQAWLHHARIYNKKGRHIGLIFQDMVVDLQGNQLGLLRKNLFRDMKGYVVAWLKGGMGGPKLPLAKEVPPPPQLGAPMKNPSMPKPLPAPTVVASWSEFSWPDFIAGPGAPPPPKKKPE